MTNSADPDQLASSEANRSGSTLFAKTGHVVFSKRRVKMGITDLTPLQTPAEETFKPSQGQTFHWKHVLIYYSP